MSHESSSFQRVELGSVAFPSGLMIIIDPSYEGSWRGRAALGDSEDAKLHDLRILGPDAERAGRAYDGDFDPPREESSVFTGDAGFEAASTAVKELE